MFTKKIVVTAGLSSSERARILEQVGAGQPPLELYPLSDTDRNKKVGQVIESALAGQESDGSRTELEFPWPLVFFAVFPRSDIDPFIAAYKSVIDRRAVFASLTETNIKWSVDDLLEHLQEEHNHVLERESQHR